MTETRNSAFRDFRLAASFVVCACVASCAAPQITVPRDSLVIVGPVLWSGGTETAYAARVGAMLKTQLEDAIQRGGSARVAAGARNQQANLRLTALMTHFEHDTSVEIHNPNARSQLSEVAVSGVVVLTRIEKPAEFRVIDLPQIPLTVLEGVHSAAEVTHQFSADKSLELGIKALAQSIVNELGLAHP